MVRCAVMTFNELKPIKKANNMSLQKRLLTNTQKIDAK